MSKTLQYFKTKSSAEGYIIEHTPFVGYAIDTKDAFFSTYPYSGIFNSEVVPLTAITYKATARVTPTNVVGTLRGQLYDPETAQGYLLYSSGPTELGQDAFYNKTALTEITIPATVSSIAWSAFLYCTNLTSIKVDESNPVYDSRNNCNGIIRTEDNTLVNACKATIIPSTVTAIGNYAFRDCRTMVSISIPNSITSIGNYAFVDCTSLQTIRIPETCILGDSVFRGCTNLTSANLPSNMEFIPQELFKNCNKLENIILPDSIKTIKNEAFYYTNLSSIVIPEGVTKIETRAFCNAGLKTLRLPSTLQTLGDAVFGNTKLETIHYNCQNLSSGTILFSNCVDSITFGTSVVRIPDNFTHSCKITSLMCPENIISIGSRAFVSGAQLSEAVLSNVETIGKLAFLSCSHLEQIDLGAGLLSVGAECFKNCTAIKNVTYSGTPESWMMVDFVDATSNPVYFSTSLTCNNLTSIEVRIPDNLTVTKPFSFINCLNLAKLHIPSHVTSIDPSTFLDTSISELIWGIPEYNIDTQLDLNNSPIPFAQNSLQSITFEEGVTKIPTDMARGCTLLQNVEIPESVTTICSGAFQDCINLSNVILPSSVEALGSGSFGEIFKGAFEGCKALKSIQFGPNLRILSECEFFGSGLESVHIPETLTIYREGLCFGMCSDLETITVAENHPLYDLRDNCNAIILTESNKLLRGTSTTTIPSSVTSLGQHSFSGLNLTSIAIPNTVTTIEGSVFSGCRQLESITLPSALSAIPRYLCSNCIKLEEVLIPASVEVIGECAFSECTALRDIMVLNPTPCELELENSDEQVYTQFPSTILRIIVPAGTVDAYKLAPGWSLYSDIITDGYVADTCTMLTITADDIPEGSLTTTTLHYSAITNGVTFFGDYIENIELTGSVEVEVEANLSTTDTVERLVSFTYLGVTAETTITHGVYCPQVYTVNLNNQWRLSTSVSNPNSDTYEGVYESYSNHNVANQGASMYITIKGYETFKLYIRSYAESNYDYIMVSQLDTALTNSSSYSNTSLVKAHTRGNQQSGTSISSYKLVEFTGIDNGTHTIQIIYRKDSSQNSGADRGFVLIPKNL